MIQPRCRDCGKFIVSEFIESPWCDCCLDRRWAEFIRCAEEHREAFV